MISDYDDFLTNYSLYEGDQSAVDCWAKNAVHDPVNHPAHYTAGRYEAIDVIQDAISHAPDNNSAFLQGQILKYLLRLWHKESSLKDAQKARWYLDRLIKDLA